MSSFPVNEFLFASRSGSLLTNSDTANWAYIDELTLVFDETSGGLYLVTLTIPDTWNDNDMCGAEFRLVLGVSGGDATELAVGYYYSALAGQRVPFSLACLAEVFPTRGGVWVAAEWAAREGGTAYIGAKGLSSLSAIGQPVP